ncbi:MAG: hypothetical protein ACKN9U_17090 [Pirellulaceae bacterium]
MATPGWVVSIVPPEIASSLEDRAADWWRMEMVPSRLDCWKVGERKRILLELIVRFHFRSCVSLWPNLRGALQAKCMTFDTLVWQDSYEAFPLDIIKPAARLFAMTVILVCDLT